MSIMHCKHRHAIPGVVKTFLLRHMTRCLSEQFTPLLILLILALVVCSIVENVQSPRDPEILGLVLHVAPRITSTRHFFFPPFLNVNKRPEAPRKRRPVPLFSRIRFSLTANQAI
jgi:hypothetical protein